jgi:hypothetical protein
VIAHNPAYTAVIGWEKIFVRQNILTYQNRILGIVVVLFGVWLAWTLVGMVRERQAGVAYYTLTTDVLGVQVGSLVTLRGYEIGQVTGVTLHPASGKGETALVNAALPVFRIDFQVVAPVALPQNSTRLEIEEVNPVAPARLTLRQALITAAPSSPPLMHPCPPSRDANRRDWVAAGGCIPTLAMEEDVRPGLGGLLAEGTETLRALRTSTLPILTGTLEQYRQAGGALEETAKRMATVSEQLHADVIARVDRLVTPETIATLAQAVTELEALILNSGRSSQETLDNLAAVTRALNQITWELERDPLGFLSGSGAGRR